MAIGTLAIPGATQTTSGVTLHVCLCTTGNYGTRCVLHLSLRYATVVVGFEPTATPAYTMAVTSLIAAINLGIHQPFGCNKARRRGTGICTSSKMSVTCAVRLKRNACIACALY